MSPSSSDRTAQVVEALPQQHFGALLLGLKNLDAGAAKCAALGRRGEEEERRGEGGESTRITVGYRL